MRMSDWSSDVCSSDLADLCLDPCRQRVVEHEARAQLHEQHHAHVALPVLPNDDRFLDLLQLLDLVVDLSRADANAARVQRGVGAPVDDDAVVLGQLDEVAVVPDVGIGLEIGGAIARRSEEHKSELQSIMRITYAVFCL